MFLGTFKERLNLQLLQILQKFNVQFGTEAGTIVLNLDKRNITSSVTFLTFTYIFSGSISCPINRKLSIGLNYRYNGAPSLSFNNDYQKVGTLVAFKL